jgi:ankyrin repeat protein
VNDANDRGSTPLHQAAYSNKAEIANILLAKGAALDAEAHDAGGTPLITALFWGL